MASCKLILDILAVLTAFLGYIPLYPYLPVLPKLSVPAALLLMAVGMRKGTAVLSTMLATAVSVGFFLYYLLQISSANLVDPAVAFMVMLLAVRLAAEKAPRHYLQVFALSLFLLAASTIHTISVLFIVYLLIMLFVITASLVLLTFHFHNPDLRLSVAEIRKIAVSALVMELVALPLMMVIFTILPRTQYPLWRIIPSSTTATAGFSETVHPGAAGNLNAARIPVFRAEMQQAGKGSLYWRAIVLNTFTQGTWVRKPPPMPEGEIPPPGQTIRQIIQMEPGASRYLCTLDIPVSVKGLRAYPSTDLVLTLSVAPSRRHHYEVMSVPTDGFAARRIVREFYLELPETLSPRIQALAGRIRAGASNDGGRLVVAEREFRGLNLSYTTHGLPTGSDPIDYFLFDGRKGNCEFFASALAVTLRAAGIPTRLVGGYYGGEYNEVAGYYLITQDMAHVWVEAYQEGKGWLRLDPSAWARGFTERLPPRKTNLWSKIGMYIDAAGYFWDRNIVTYDLERQLNAARRTGELLRGFSIGKRALFIAGAGILILCAFSLIFILGLYLLRPREERLLRNFQRTIGRRFSHLGKIEKIGLHEAAVKCGDPLVAEFADLYCGAIYRDRRLTKDESLRLRNILKSLRNNCISE